MRNHPTIEMAFKAAKILDVNVDDLYEGDEEYKYFFKNAYSFPQQ